MCFSRRDASTDMQHDLSGSKGNLTWPWPKAKFWPWLFKVKMHIFRRVSTSGTRWRPNYFASFLCSKVIREKKLFLSKTSILTFLDLYRPFENTERVFSHFSERVSQEIWNALFRGLLSMIVSEITARFRRKYKISLNFDLPWPLVTSTLTWAKNWP